MLSQTTFSEESQDATPTSGDEESTASMSGDAFHSSADSASILGIPGALVCSRSRNSSRTSFELAAGETFREITADNLHEYFWPLNSVADRYFIQEQLAVFLDVKSFKRKYPDLNRRPIVEAEERTYLLQREVVTQTQLNMGLTAVRAEDVYDLMTNDYPEKFAVPEYKKVIAERNKQAMAVKQMELQAIKSDSRRLEEWRKKAMRSAIEWNSELNRDRGRDRKCFFDMQTMVIQEPVRKRSRPHPANFGPYPAALVPDQFQEFYKRYNSEDLYRLPVNGVSRVEEYLSSRRPHSPDPITVKPEELLQGELEESKRKRDMDATPSTSKPKTLASVASTERLSTREGRGEETGESCAFCQEDIYQGDRFVQCSKCGSCGHPICMDMTDEMYDVVKTYNWMCMECKPCSICSKLDEEDKMLFCDRCDRGYHTFCVGLSELPSGRWVCPKFCVGGGQRYKAGPVAFRSTISDKVNDKAAEAAVAAVVATPSTLKPNMTLDQTVEEVAQAVLAGVVPGDIPSSLLVSFTDFSDLKSGSSLSNSPRSTPEPQTSKRRSSVASANAEVPCARCGGPTGGKKSIRGGRKLLLCSGCLAASLEDGKKRAVGEESSNSGSQG